MHFRALEADSCFYVHKDIQNTFLVLFVDDLLLAAADDAYIKTFKSDASRMGLSGLANTRRSTN